MAASLYAKLKPGKMQCVYPANRKLPSLRVSSTRIAGLSSALSGMSKSLLLSAPLLRLIFNRLHQVRQSTTQHPATLNAAHHHARTSSGASGFSGGLLGQLRSLHTAHISRSPIRDMADTDTALPAQTADSAVAVASRETLPFLMSFPAWYAL